MPSTLASSAVVILVPPWQKHKNAVCFCFLFHSNRNTPIFPFRISSSFTDGSVPLPKPNQLGYDPPQEPFGFEGDLQTRSISSYGARKPRSWFGPNGQYIRELPCPSCRGRGYTLCTECKFEKPRLDCSGCNGKGLQTCHQCMGDRVIWEEAIDERPWEKARSISPFKMKEDDEVDNLDVELKTRNKSKRIYQSPSAEVGLKISRSLKSLNAKTGLFSKRMKIIHRDPVLHAQRVAAIKRARGTAAARKHASEAMKDYFRDPANRLKRSIAMKGVKFYCKSCGGQGHRRHYCPELKLIDSRVKCGLCGQKGHNRRTCEKTTAAEGAIGKYNCGLCKEKGHNSRTCDKKMGHKGTGTRSGGGRKVQNGTGRTVPHKKGFRLAPNVTMNMHRPAGRIYSCSVCHKIGHNRRTCPIRSNLLLSSET